MRLYVCKTIHKYIIAQLLGTNQIRNKFLICETRRNCKAPLTLLKKLKYVIILYIHLMAFKPVQEKVQDRNSAEINNPQQEADLKLEQESQVENEDNKNREQQEKMARETGEQKARPTIKRRPIMPAPVKDETIIKIEKILEEGMNDSFQRLSPVAQQEFKLKGEQTATQIRDLLKNTHVKVKKILRLILDWLRMLPGINHFFLEQEAKIKTDKIISLKNKF